MLIKKKLFNFPQVQWDLIGQGAAIGLAFAVPVSTAITSILVAIILLSWILGPNQAEKRWILVHHPLVVWLYPIIFLAILGMTYSMGDNDTIRRSVIDSLRLGVIPILIYYYQPKALSKMALWAFAAAMVLTLVLAFLKVYANFPIGLKYTTGAVFKSHIKTSYFMAIAAFFLAFQIKYVAKQYRFVLIGVVALMVYYLLFMSVGRIGYLTLMLCLLMLAWQWYRLKGMLWASLIAVLMFGGAYMTSSVFSDRVNMLAQDLDFYHEGGRLLESSLGSRIQFADSSTSLIIEKPFFGWGTGSYALAYAKLFEGKSTLLTDNPHNEYLRISVELGLLGLGMLLLLFYKQWRLSSQLPLDVRGFCKGVLLTFMLGCTLNSWLKDFSEGYFYCLMTAICFASLPVTAQKKLVKATLH